MMRKPQTRANSLLDKPNSVFKCEFLTKKQVGVLLMPVVYGVVVVIFVFGMIGLAIKAIIIEGLK